jgi:hypothetical protein
MIERDHVAQRFSPIAAAAIQPSWKWFLAGALRESA